MIRIRYSKSELEVAGSPAELRVVASRLARIAQVGGEEAIATFHSAPPLGGTLSYEENRLRAPARG